MSLAPGIGAAGLGAGGGAEPAAEEVALLAVPASVGDVGGQAAPSGPPRRLAAAVAVVAALATAAAVTAALPSWGAARHEGEGLPDRVLLEESLDGARPQGNGGVTVLLAGTLVRYFPNLDRHVVAPMARQGRAVDVFLSLSVEGFTSWRGSGDSFVMHPGYQGKDLDEVRDMIADGIRDHGGTAVVIRMPDKVELTPRGQAFRDNGTWWTKDPTTKAGQNLQHARTTRGNVAKLYRELEGLWTDAKANEEETGESYEYVMIFRDDSNWLLDFDLDRLLRTGGQVVLDGSAGRALGQKCGPQGLPRLCDYVVVAERAIAEPFGSFYKMMTDPASMGVFLDPRSESVLEGERYMYQLLQSFDIRFEHVPTALIPFERCGRMNIAGSTVVCRHKSNDESFDGIAKLGVKSIIPDVCELLAGNPE